MINQATNYMTVTDRYSLIITVNITCMMVLASIYLSVSASLPVTSDIKPIEVWLLFNLAYPFITILVNVMLQVEEDAGRDNDLFVFVLDYRVKEGGRRREKIRMKYIFVIFKSF